jgi:hypothetical protein
VRFYPTERPVLKTYGDPDELLSLLDGTTGEIFKTPPGERVIETFAPMKWFEYLRVTDLPFSQYFQ